MTISIKPTASGSTIEQDGSTILTVDGSGNITPSNSMYPKVPAFAVYRSGTQSVTSGVYTKIAFNAETFDTDNLFDATTNYRFQPSIAGYYQLNCVVAHNGTSVSSAVPAVYKNGSIYQYGPYIQATNANSCISTMLYLNGTTDYVEIYAYQTASTAAWSGNGYSTWFNGHLVSV